MKEAYQDPAHEASFGGVDALYHAAKGKVKRSEIRTWLQGVDAYTLHKPTRKKFPTNRVIVYGMDHQWQADLVDVSSLREFNDDHRYILTCIDVLSKYAWAVALKEKRGLIKVFENIFRERKPKIFQTDQGTEFKNTAFKAFMKRQGVRFFTTFNDTKASVVERFNRTLKTKMWKYFTRYQTYRYLDVLPKLLESYNHTYHFSIRRAPIDVTLENQDELWQILYGDLQNVKSQPCRFQPGDIVRVSKQKLTFEKGYETNWSEELFEVTECVNRHPKVYRLKDLLDETIHGTFYAQELQKVTPSQEYAVENILKKRKRYGQLEYFVKYRGYPEKFNQWLPANNLTSI